MPVRTIEAKGKHLKTFLRLPWRIYDGDGNWVPPLLAMVRPFFDGRSPFLRHGRITPLLAFRDGRPVGRIAAIVNRRHNEVHDDRTGFFGFFECEDDDDAAKALLEAAAGHLKAAGCDTMLGPVSPSTNDECAMLVDGFDSPPTFMMPYNPRYYPRLMEAAGLEKAKDVLSFIMYDTAQLPPKLFRVAEMARKRSDLEIRGVRMNRLREELVRIKTVYNEAWEKNWGFVPMTDEEIDHMAKDLKAILEPELVLMAEHEGEPAGFSLAVPDVYQALIHVRGGRLFPFGFVRFLLHKKDIKRVRVMAMGVREKFRVRGVDAVFYLETFERGRRLGYTEGEMGWVLEDNRVMCQTIEAVGGTVYKRYRFYARAL